MKLISYFEDVYYPTRLLGRSPRTLVLYRTSIALFSRFLGRDATLDDLTDVTVGKHLAALLEAGRRPAGVNKERDQLLAIWRFAARKKLVAEFPEIRRLPEPESPPRAWTMDELYRLRISCNYVPGTYEGVPANLWWLALHEVLWTTGERITAVMKSTWDCYQDGVLTFPAEFRKGRQKANVCQLPRTCRDALEAIREPKRKLIFCWPYVDVYLYRIYHRILERAGLDTGRKSKFHRMRKSHATYVKLAGGNPTASLLHSSAEITEAYLDPRMFPKPAPELIGGLGDITLATSKKPAANKLEAQVAALQEELAQLRGRHHRPEPAGNWEADL